MILVGTHKDKLETFGSTKKSRQRKLGEAQKILTDFIHKLFVAKKTSVVDNIKRPSGDGGEWFFAVDNKSRKTNLWSGEMRCKDSVIEVRNALEQMVLNDQRKVKGLWSVAVSKGRLGRMRSGFARSLLIFIDTFPCLPQVWMASQHRMSISQCQRVP